MAYDVVMPQLGMTMEEGSVLRWLKQAGDTIVKGEPLFEVQTDKVDMEVEAQASGVVLQILIEEGKVVPVGSVLARIGEEGSQAPPVQNLIPAEERNHTEESVAPPAAAIVRVSQSDGHERIDAGESSQKLASPRARKVARDLAVDIRQVPGRGQGGRIREIDVRDYVAAQNASPPTVSSGAGSSSLTVSSIRKTIAQRTTESFQRAPHFYLSSQADATALQKLREDLLPDIENSTSVRLSYTDLLIKAIAIGLKENPRINASWKDGEIVQGRAINIGFAAQAGDALLVPVIRSADTLSVAAIAKARSELAGQARAGTIRLSDLEGGSCTLSNLGAFGVDQFQAIINPPQSAILAVGSIEPRPFVVGGQLTVRTTVWLTLSVDHRVADGVAGAAFLQSIVRGIQSPYRLLHDVR